MKDVNYQRYISSANECLKEINIRPLTKEEEAIVLAHLKETHRTYRPDNLDDFDLMSTLCLEVVRKALEIHPDIEAPTPGQVMKGIEAIKETVTSFEEWSLYRGE